MRFRVLEYPILGRNKMGAIIQENGYKLYFSVQQEKCKQTADILPFFFVRKSNQGHFLAIKGRINLVKKS